MLANDRPFARIVYKSSKDAFQMNTLYQLFQDDNKEFWFNHCEYDIIIDENVKQLIYLMLKYNPQDRISTQQIMQSIWYNQETIASDEMKHTIESLTTIHSSNSTLNQQTHSGGGWDDVGLIPFWMEYTKVKKLTASGNHFLKYYYMKPAKNTTYWRDVMNIFSDFVEYSMSGQVSYDDTTSRLRCLVKKSIPIEFNISILRSSKLNSFSSTNTTFVLIINITHGDMKQFELIEQQMMNISKIKQLISTDQIDSDNITLDLAPSKDTPINSSVCYTAYIFFICCVHTDNQCIT